MLSKAQSGQNVTGQAMLEVQRQSTVLSSGTDYEENFLRVKIGADGKFTIKVDASGLNGNICLDRFALTTVVTRIA